MANTGQAFPSISEPIVDKDRKITVAFRYFLQNLWQRTGGGPGQDITAVAAQAAAAQLTANTALAQAAASLKKAANLSDVANSVTSLHALINIAGWNTPTGTLVRTTFNANQSTIFSVLYSASEGQAVNDQLVIVQQRLAALITDLENAHVLQP